MCGQYIELLDNALFQKAWGEIFERLPDKEAGQLIKAIFEFMDGGEPEFEDIRLEGCFLGIASHIEASAKRYAVKAGLIG